MNEDVKHTSTESVANIRSLEYHHGNATTELNSSCFSDGLTVLHTRL